MKTFIFKENKYRNRKRNNRECVIYQIKNNTPIIIGIISYTTGSTMGAESEVFHFLIENGFIPKSYYNLSKNEWRGGGYYCQEVESKGIKIIEI